MDDQPSCCSCKKSPCGLTFDGEVYVCGECLLKFRQAAIDLHEDDPCFYDHHGYCQTHLLHERPCPHEIIKELLNG